MILLCLICCACGSTAPSPDDVHVVTAIPTAEATPTNTPEEITTLQSQPCSVSGNFPTLPDYEPSSMSWVGVNGSHLSVSVDGTGFPVYGVNYYPRMAPFGRFLTDSEIDVIGKELDVIVPSGINTLRIFINLDQLFTCENQPIPDVDIFAQVDQIMRAIASKNLRMIVVLHQDLSTPETATWEHLQFFIQRYANEAAIIAWDVLDKGDTHYDTWTAEVVLTWLANAILAIRQVDNQHLITASWQSNSIDTEPLVDVVSFQHFGEYLPFQQEIANLKATTNKPILLSAIRYSTFDVDETAQRNLIFQAIEEVRNNDLAGWAVYAAFDYPTSVTCIEPDCPASPSSINFYGIWNTSYFPKLAVDAIKRVTESE